MSAAPYARREQHEQQRGHPGAASRARGLVAHQHVVGGAVGAQALPGRLRGGLLGLDLHHQRRRVEGRLPQERLHRRARRTQPRGLWRARPARRGHDGVERAARLVRVVGRIGGLDGVEDLLGLLVAAVRDGHELRGLAALDILRVVGVQPLVDVRQKLRRRRIRDRAHLQPLPEGVGHLPGALVALVGLLGDGLHHDLREARIERGVAPRMGTGGRLRISEMRRL
jgi:hypothetical protein